MKTRGKNMRKILSLRLSLPCRALQSDMSLPFGGLQSDRGVIVAPHDTVRERQSPWVKKLNPFAFLRINRWMK